jgi:hypothetical protein
MKWFIFGIVVISSTLGGIVGFKFGCDHTMQKVYKIIDNLKPKDK